MPGHLMFNSLEQYPEVWFSPQGSDELAPGDIGPHRDLAVPDHVSGYDTASDLASYLLQGEEKPLVICMEASLRGQKLKSGKNPQEQQHFDMEDILKKPLNYIKNQ